MMAENKQKAKPLENEKAPGAHDVKGAIVALKRVVERIREIDGLVDQAWDLLWNGGQYHKEVSDAVPELDEARHRTAMWFGYLEHIEIHNPAPPVEA